MDGVDEFRACTEDGDRFALGELEEDLSVVCEWISVKENERGFGGEAAYEPVPHHPPAGREVEEAIERTDACMEAMLLEVLEKRSPLPVDDAFGLSRGSARVENVEGVVEGEALKTKGRAIWLFRRRIRKGLEEDRALQGFFRWRAVEVRHDDGRMLEAESLVDLFGFREGLDALSTVDIAIACEKEDGLNLAKAIEHAIHPEIRRARREDGSKPRGGEHDEDGFWEVRQIGGDSSSSPHARCTHRALEPSYLLVHLAKAKRSARPLLGGVDHCDGIIPAPEEVFCEV